MNFFSKLKKYYPFIFVENNITLEIKHCFPNTVTLQSENIKLLTKKLSFVVILKSNYITDKLLTIDKKYMLSDMLNLYLNEIEDNYFDPFWPHYDYINISKSTTNIIVELNLKEIILSNNKDIVFELKNYNNKKLATYAIRFRDFYNYIGLLLCFRQYVPNCLFYHDYMPRDIFKYILSYL
jgi:hypothetical protein